MEATTGFKLSKRSRNHLGGALDGVQDRHALNKYVTLDRLPARCHVPLCRFLTVISSELEKRDKQSITSGCIMSSLTYSMKITYNSDHVMPKSPTQNTDPLKSSNTISVITLQSQIYHQRHRPTQIKQKHTR